MLHPEMDDGIFLNEGHRDVMPGMRPRRCAKRVVHRIRLDLEVDKTSPADLLEPSRTDPFWPDSSQLPGHIVLQGFGPSRADHQVSGS
eukprot:symbB.v1.2.003695.t2/scaffold206.1/size269131/2